MPQKIDDLKNIKEMNLTITKLRDEVAILRETVNMLLEMVVESEEGEYEEMPATSWETLAAGPQSMLGMGM